jgi:hypothetical protein
MKQLLYVLIFASCAGAQTWDILSPATGSQLTYDANLGFQLVLEGNVGFYVQAGYSGWTDATASCQSQWRVHPATTGGTYTLALDCVPPYINTPTALLNNQQTAIVYVELMYGNQTKYYWFYPPNPVTAMAGQSPSNSVVPPVDQFSAPTLEKDYVMITLPTGRFRKTKEEVRIPRGDKLDVGTVQYAHSAGAYSYTFDNRQVARLTIGSQNDPAMDITSATAPAGWIGAGLHQSSPYAAFGQFKGSTLSDVATYTITTAKLPGLVVMRLQTDWNGHIASLNGQPQKAAILLGQHTTMGAQKGADTIAIAGASSVWNNSLIKYIIGPVFDAQPKPADVQAAIKQWVDDYGFEFLSPLVGSGDPKAALESLKPTRQIDIDIVDSLRSVLAIAR